MHAMGTLNSAIKMYLLAKGRSDIRLDRDATLEKLHFRILKFSCVCWDLPGNLITASSRPFSRTVLII